MKSRATSGISGRTGTGRYLIESADTSLRFAVIGAGRLGASLAIALRDRGSTLTGITAHTPAGRARARAWTGVEAAPSIEGLVVSRPDLFVISVPDDAVRPVAAELGALLKAEPGPRPPVVLHTSGATSVSALLPCAEAGCLTLVFHPLQTFPDPSVGAGRFAGAAIAVTPAPSPAQPAATAFGLRLAALLQARPFLLPDERRALYHAAATLACNYLVTLEDRALALFTEAGLPAAETASLVLPLVRSTLDNIEAVGTVAALTGPLSRGDATTIERHLDALAQDSPVTLPLYISLGLATLDLVAAQGTLDCTQVAGLRQLLARRMPSPAPVPQAPSTALE